MIQLEPVSPSVFTGPTGKHLSSGQIILRHIVTYEMRHDTTIEIVENALRLLVEECSHDTVLGYEVALSENTSGGIILSQTVAFADNNALQTFLSSLAHRQLSVFMRRAIVAFNVSDYHVSI